MIRSICSMFLFIAIILVGCENKHTSDMNDGDVIKLSGEKPPPVAIEVNKEIYSTQLGSYCWGSPGDGRAECIDTAGPVELLVNEKPIQVSQNESITLSMDFSPLPNDVSLYLLNDDDEQDVPLEEQYKFSAPEESGTYYYSYETLWTDETNNVVYASAFYAFALEVK